MEKYRIYGERSPEPTELELKNRTLAKLAAGEGIVLLENDGTLPLKTRKIALYGAGARHTVKGGTGSGDVQERYSVSIEDGLKAAGFELVCPTWLDRYDGEYRAAQAAYHDRVEAAVSGFHLWQSVPMLMMLHDFRFCPPAGSEILDGDLSAEANTAVYVIARQAGEGADRRCEPGDYLLSGEETGHLRRLAEHYANLIVVINAGGMLDLSPLDALPVSAVLFYGQAGEEGGNALGEILAGTASPCGHLTDTWGKNYADYPTAHAHEHETLDDNYREGIYVGYRWFAANGIAPRYPFGFGLSYTKFSCTVQGVTAADGSVRVSVCVENAGAYPGKEVVQCYLARPGVKYPCEKQVLTAFSKTGLLSPGEGATLTLCFALRDFAVYDEAQAAFVLEEGEYGVFIGTDAERNEPVAVLTLAEAAVTEQCKTALPKRANFDDFVPMMDRSAYPAELPRIPMDGLFFETHDYTCPFPAVSDRVQGYLNTLSDRELALFAVGGGYLTKQFHRVRGSCGSTTSALLRKGIPNVVMSDGPAGINISQKAAYTKRGGQKYVDELPWMLQWGKIGRIAAKCRFLFAKEGDLRVYQFCTAWPNAATLAQTWNTELIGCVGAAVGEEMRKMGVTLWLAPAMNIHRDPLCGRNFEYYSEDPVVAGECAAAMTRGVQSVGGVGVTVKHFACNNRENDRMELSANLSERALRDIYLKGFRIACRAKPWALMSSYNRINGTYSPNSRELLTDILRCEWGYGGLVMSDWGAVDKCSVTEAVRCGNSLIMPGGKGTYKKVCAALADGSLTRADLLPGAAYALNLVFCAATSEGF